MSLRPAALRLAKRGLDGAQLGIAVQHIVQRRALNGRRLLGERLACGQGQPRGDSERRK